MNEQPTLLLASLEPFMMHRQVPLPASLPPKELSKVAAKQPRETHLPAAGNGCNDCLFGCFLQLVGEDATTAMHQVHCMQAKIKWAPVFTEKVHRAKLKQLKLCNLTTVETDLVNDPYVSVPVFLSLCATQPWNVLMIWSNRTCYRVTHPAAPEGVWHVVREVDRRRKVYQVEEGATDGAATAESYLELTNLQKPLQAMSGYTVKVLRDMCGKVQLPDQGTKTELYERLVQHLVVV